MTHVKCTITTWTSCDGCGREMYTSNGHLPRHWHKLIIRGRGPMPHDICPDCYERMTDEETRGDKVMIGVILDG